LNIDDYLKLRYSRKSTLYVDSEGILLTAEELDKLPEWEIEERKIRVSEC